MKVTCKRCGASFDAKTARREYCDACRRAKRSERPEAAGEKQNHVLLAERQRRRMTVAEMAAWVGTPASTYYNLEHNGAKPGEALRRRIADKLGVAADKLFGPLLYDRVCRDCGTYYQAEHAKSRICPECAGRAQAARLTCRRKQRGQGIQEVARAAREAGMSYGKYVARKEQGAV